MTSFKDYPIQTIDQASEEFPDFLRQINKPVELLHYRGVWNPELFTKALAVVGSRRNTRYGSEIIDRFLPRLIDEKLTIVSGFMYGIDTLAHKKALELGGKTIAVLGSGLDKCTPPTNEKLYLEIIEHGGLVVSEYEHEFNATLWSFPQRNRIVAAISNLGVLVVEASISSGSLITARMANEMGRDVFAVPGSIFSKTSTGCHELIQQLKANLVVGPEDILHLPHQYSEENQLNLFEDLSPLEKKIVNALARENSSIDELARELGVSAPEVASSCSVLNMKDVVSEVNGVFSLIR